MSNFHASGCRDDVVAVACAREAGVHLAKVVLMLVFTK